jgi:hypothetical protein
MNHKPAKSIFSHPVYILVIVTFVILVTAGLASWRAMAQDIPPVIRVSTSNNYLRADNFLPGGTVTFTVYESLGSENVILEINRTADES